MEWWARSWSGALAWALSLGAYLLTLCPTVYVEGSGELIGATALLGTPHPTGYPLYCLLGRLCAALIPAGSPAHQINLFTALGAAAAVGAFGALLQHRGLNPWIALGSSLVFAFSTTFWSQAVIAEVYGLAMLGAVALLWAALRCIERKGGEGLPWLAYIAGLSLTLHLSLVLFWPAIGLGWWRRKRAFELGLMGRALGAFALGLSPVLYLVIRNGRGDGFHWGRISSASQWWDHLNGALYRDSFFSLPPAALLLNLQRWATQMLGEFHPLLLPIALLGAWAGFCRDRTLWWLAMGGLVCNLALALNYHRDPNGIGVFFLVSILALACCLAWGLQYLVERRAPVRFRGALGPLAALGAAALVLGAHWAGADRSQNRIAHQYGSDILNGLPPGAVLIAEGDDASFILDYLQRLEGMRPDVRLYNRMGLGRDLLEGQALDLDPARRMKLRLQLEAELLAAQERPVFYLYARRIPSQAHRLVPAGLCYRAWPAGQPFPPDSLGSEPELARTADPGWHRDPWVRKIQSNYAFMAGEHRLARGDTSGALAAYREAARIACDSRSTQFNVALIMFRNSRLDEAQTHAAAAAALDPWNPEVHHLMAQIRLRGTMDSPTGGSP
jgi:hypothetical protein